jgi:predicted nucleic acid-binding protein
MTPDVNVLIAAFRRDHQHHAVALQWLDDARVACAEGRTALALLPMVIAGFIRLVTNRRVFRSTSSLSTVIS